MSSSDVIVADVARVVAVTYPIHAMTPSIPPTIMSIVSCCIMGLHSESIKRYAYTKNPIMASRNIITPTFLRLLMSCEIYNSYLMVILYHLSLGSCQIIGHD